MVRQKTYLFIFLLIFASFFSLVSLAEAGLDVGLNFRATTGYVADGANETYVIRNAYPTTRGGLTFGFSVNGNLINANDRNSGNDRRLAGVNQRTNTGVQSTFRIDLPNTGTYDIYLALGDASFGQAYQYVELKDDTATFQTINDTNGTVAQHFDDTNGTDFTNVTWPGGNQPISHAFTSTILNIVIGTPTAQLNSTTLAHVRLVERSAKINVTSNLNTTWGISPGGISGSGTSDYHMVIPDLSVGTTYTITPAEKAGYTYEVSNSTFVDDDQMTLFAGDDETFTIVYTAIPQTANINVTSNLNTTWNISPGEIFDSGTEGNYVVTPDGSLGTNYTIFPADIAGYTYEVSNSKTGNYNNMTLFPGNDETFTITYTSQSSFNYSLSGLPGITITQDPFSNAVGTYDLYKILDSGDTEPVYTEIANGLEAIPGISVNWTTRDCSPDEIPPGCNTKVIFTISPSAEARSYEVDLKNTPLDSGSPIKYQYILLNIEPPSEELLVSCSASPSPANVHEGVTWTANVSGGTGPYTFSWSGTDVPEENPPSSQQFVINYETTGMKQATVVVNDSAENQSTCQVTIINIGVSPFFRVF
jgi:hypothetical protein